MSIHAGRHAPPILPRSPSSSRCRASQPKSESPVGPSPWCVQSLAPVLRGGGVNVVNAASVLAPSQGVGGEEDDEEGAVFVLEEEDDNAMPPTALEDEQVYPHTKHTHRGLVAHTTHIHSGSTKHQSTKHSATPQFHAPRGPASSDLVTRGGCAGAHHRSAVGRRDDPQWRQTAAGSHPTMTPRWVLPAWGGQTGLRQRG